MIRICLIAALAMAASVVNISLAPAQSPPVSAPAAMTAQERLDACAQRYAQAKTYRDEGEVITEMKSAHPIIDTKPFTTAFERDGRFLWEFDAAVSPGGKPSTTYTVWSTDQETFHSHWTLNGQSATFDQFSMAMAGPMGVSGGSATAIIPLLVSGVMYLRTTDVADAKESGVETIDGHKCVKIEGDSRMGRVTLWLDETHAIRKIYRVMEIDPSKIPPPPGGEKLPTDKFIAITTINIKPVFDEAIADAQFAPPAAAR